MTRGEGKTGRRLRPAGGAGAVEAIRRELLRWYRRSRRSLPWRDAPDPYRVLVSEIMLQQTRVSVVVPYFERFLKRFPTVGDLAAASVDDVLAAWSGLGYYGRARRLHQAARSIVGRHGGRFPAAAAAVRELPGVGRYTAGAILSIAFGKAEPLVDGNVSRVLARLRGIEGDVRSAAVARRLWAEARELLDPRRPGDFNQALMELGAMVCTPGAPDCPACPVSRHCTAHATGRQGELPTPVERGAARQERAAAVVLRRSGRLLLVRRPPGGLLAGMWEFPGVPGEDDDPTRLARELRRRHRIEARVGESLGEVRHGILDRRIRLAVRRGRLLEAPSRTAGPGAWRWAAPDQALGGGLALAASARKVLALLERA